MFYCDENTKIITLYIYIYLKLMSIRNLITGTFIVETQEINVNKIYLNTIDNSRENTVGISQTSLIE